MYYLTTYTYLEQIKHKHKLGFKYNTIEELIIVFYALSIAQKIIEYIINKYYRNLYEYE